MKKRIFFLVSLFLLISSFSFVWAYPGQGTPVKFENPLVHENMDSFLSSIMTNLESVLVTVAIIMIVIGGIMYMLSFGNEKAMERAKNVVLAAVIGLAIALSARTFLQTIWDVVGAQKEGPGGDSLMVIAGRLLTILLSLVGVIAIISLVVGGIMYLTSYGDDDRIQKGKKIIVASIFGIIISVGAVILVKQVAWLIGYNL